MIAITNASATVATRWRLAPPTKTEILANLLIFMVRASGFEPETY